jgi:hypothetical protein
LTSLVLSWLAFPLLLGLLSVGTGLAVRWLVRGALPGVLVPAIGIATMVVLAELAVTSDATAELLTPAVVGIALAGFVMAKPWKRRRDLDPWPVVAAAGVFAVFAAPVVLSGEATIAGYTRLDDTATWLAIADRAIEHGRNLEGLAPSTYEAALATDVPSGYPIGVFLPPAIGAVLLGEDVAWLFQPYLSFLAAMLALVLYGLVRPVTGRPWLAALLAFLAAQSALLLGYALWGGVKEVAATMLVALVAALVPVSLRGEGARSVIPLVLASVAIVPVLSFAGAVWLGLPLLVAVLVGVRTRLSRLGVARLAVFGIGFAALAAPTLLSGALLPRAHGTLTDARELGALFAPLNPLQVLGIWPSGDFRFSPDREALSYLLIAVVIGAQAAFGLVLRQRPWPLLVYVGTTPVTCLLIALVGSPWVDAKSMAIASPALLVAALVGAAALLRTRFRIAGGTGLAILAAGVLWSSALAYHDVTLAPRAQLEELEEIGEEIAGQGPTLMTEYMPYGVRHFLRRADPEGASEFRRRLLPLASGDPSLPSSVAADRTGGSLGAAQYADTDEFRMTGLLIYRTLVLRRSPTQSRPPSPYRLTWTGRYYEVWQRPVDSESSVIEHLGLGGPNDQTARPECSDVLRLAGRAGKGGLAAVSRPSPAVLAFPAAASYPRRWEPKQEQPRYILATSPGQLRAEGPGTLRATVRIAREGRYRIWLGGSVRGEMKAAVDGVPVGSARQQLNRVGGWIPFGAAAMTPGKHEISLSYSGQDLHPGSGNQAAPIGPLAVTTDRADPGVRRLPASRAGELCGKRWDWIEALG